MKPKISIATMTCELYGNANLMLEALSVLSKKGYSAFIADGGSSDKFISSLEKMGHVVTSVKGGLTFQHKDSMIKAGKSAENVLYTEPDKLDWFNFGLDSSMDLYLHNEYEFSPVSRTPIVMSTYPKYQQKTEELVNDYISTHIFGENGRKMDFIYGPKLFISDLTKQTEKITTDIGWGVLMFLVARAGKQNLKIGSLPYAAPCPVNQKCEDNYQYRIKQMKDNINGFEYANNLE